MKAQTVKDTLVAARWILDHLGWCQGTGYRDAEGKRVDLSDRSVIPRIASVCAVGALYLVENDGYQLYERAIDTLNKHLTTENMFSASWSIVSWNDQPGRTKQEVLDLFDRTIKDQP